MAAARAIAASRRMLLAAGAALAACGNLLPPADLKPPTVSFTRVAIESASADRVVLRVTLVAANPNGIDLPLSDVRFDLSLLGQPVGRGEITEPSFRLPAQGSRELPLRFTVAAADLRAMLLRLAMGASPESVWALQGSARWGASPMTIPFERRGDADALVRLLREQLRRFGG